MHNLDGGESEAPTTILDAMTTQPLSYLISKDELAGLIKDPLKVHFENDTSVFAGKRLKDVGMENQQGINLDPSNRYEHMQIVYKRPRFLTRTENHDPQALNLLQGLSPLAMNCLLATGRGVSTADIQAPQPVMENSKPKPVTETRKRLNEDDLAPRKSLDSQLISNKSTTQLSQPNKRANNTKGVSLNKNDMGNIYLENLNELTTKLGLASNHETKIKDLETWRQLTQNVFITTESFLKKMQRTIEKIYDEPSIWSQVNIEVIQRISDVMVDNIVHCSERLNEDSENILLKQVAYMSIIILFTVHLFELDNQKLTYQHYVLEPINFLAKTSECLKVYIKGEKLSKTEITSFKQCISLLPAYISSKPYIDEELVTKLIYMFTDLLLNEEVEFQDDIQLQNSWDGVKKISSGVIIALFNKLPDQREFILEEFLSQIDKIPSKRLQKKLWKISNNTFATNFTITLLEMLETINGYDDLKFLSKDDTDFAAKAQKVIQLKFDDLEGIFDVIISFIMDKTYENPSRYRHVLENVVFDLIALVPLKDWPVAEGLLTELFKRMLLTFSPSHPKNTNVESICLQLIGNIGSMIYEVKCDTPNEYTNNLVKIYNNLDILPSLLKNFSSCIAALKATNSKVTTYKYLCCLKINILSQLTEFAKDDEEKKSQLDAIIADNLVFDDINLHIATDDKIGTNQQQYYSILHALNILNLYEPYLKLILSLLTSDKIKLRSNAIKCLSMLASKNPVVFSHPMVKVTIQDQLENSPASVKDAILDLISIGSSYLHYYNLININSNDDSVQVRKHVLKLNYKIYNDSEELNVKSYAISRILMKIEDEEDTIIEMARGMLMEKWIFDVAKLQNQPEEQRQTVERIIEGMSSITFLNNKISDLFEQFLNFYLLNEEIHNAEIISTTKKSLSTLTELLVHEIVELQARESANPNDMQKSKRYMLLLATFSDSMTTFITREHVASLYPYLVAEETNDLQCYILKIFKNTMMKINNFKVKFLFDMETTILSLLPRMSVKEIEEAIPLVWLIGLQRQDTSRIARACSSCFALLNPYINICNKSPSRINVDGKLLRLIYLATGFGRFTTFDKTKAQVNYINEGETVYEYVAKCLLVLSKDQVPHSVRRVAAKNLTALCASHPKLFNSKHVLHLLDKELTSSHTDIQLAILEGLHDFFVSEEHKSIRKSGLNLKITSNSRKDVFNDKETFAEHLNDGICSALVSRFLKNILRLCHVQDKNLHLVSIRLLKIITQFGYTNPSHCIPTIVSLIGSSDDLVANIATKILSETFEKYETFVWTGIQKGFQLTFDSMRSAAESKSPINDQYLLNIQKIMQQGNKNISKFLKAIDRMFHVELKGITSQPPVECNMRIVIFLCANLAKVDFATQLGLANFIKRLEFYTEELRDVILNVCDGTQDNEAGEKSTYMLMVAHKSMEDLRAFLLSYYGIKCDALSLDSIEETDLRSKKLIAQRTNNKNFTDIISANMRYFDRKNSISKYRTMIDKDI